MTKLHDTLENFKLWFRVATKDFRPYGIEDLQNALDKPSINSISIDGFKTQHHCKSIAKPARLIDSLINLA